MARLPLLALESFAMLARCGSVTAAAAELGVTPGAISRQLAGLEARLKVRLAERGARGITLTDAGQDLAHRLADSFTLITQAIHRFDQGRPQRSLTVGVPRTYTTRFLASRLKTFLDAQPGLSVLLDGSRHDADLTRGEADLCLRFGRGTWPDATVVERLGDERCFPVCAPTLLAGRDPEAALRDMPLLHFAELDDWPWWLALTGRAAVDAARGPRFSETTMVLEAAAAGLGFAIGRTSLVTDALAAGSLVAPFGQDWPDRYGYWLAGGPRSLHRPAARAFWDWVVATAARR